MIIVVAYLPVQFPDRSGHHGDPHRRDRPNLHLPFITPPGHINRGRHGPRRNQPKKARVSSLIGLACSLLMGLVAMSFAMIVWNTWAGMFISDATITALTVIVLQVVGFNEVGDFPQTMGCSMLRGSSRPNLGTYINT
ncbi:hypothetical protein MLD38_028585 [Melastoma candidum]|uniref:Uncharacterized protein n=1 Tax=Melastoma candidum TaxID=119954 RepID=A0ACB9N2B0_9MYRT|nr:hypothetical protein MLD38_028585 [Melastoma candidum]